MPSPPFSTIELRSTTNAAISLLLLEKAAMPVEPLRATTLSPTCTTIGPGVNESAEMPVKFLSTVTRLSTTRAEFDPDGSIAMPLPNLVMRQSSMCKPPSDLTNLTPSCDPPGGWSIDKPRRVTPPNEALFTIIPLGPVAIPPLVPVQSIVIDLRIVTGPKLPASTHLMMPSGSVTSWAIWKEPHGAARVHEEPLPLLATQVSGMAWAGVDSARKSPSMLGNAIVFIVGHPQLCVDALAPARRPYRGSRPR